MSDLIAINAGAFNLAIQALKRAGKDEIAEQLESDCECVPDLIEQLEAQLEKKDIEMQLLKRDLQLERELHHATESGVTELAATVERLKLERDSVCHLNDDLSAELNQLRGKGK